MTRLIFIRHGETEFNRTGRVQGHSNSELTDLGREQAYATALALRERGVDHIYSSDLSRARATAQIIGDRLGLTVRLDPRLREMAFGQLEGRTWSDLDRFFRDATTNGAGDWFTATPPGGESRAQLSDRGAAVGLEIAERHPEQTVVLVSHGGLIGFFLRRVLEMRVDLPYVGFRTRNCALNTFEYRDGRFHLLTWGELSHLDDRAMGVPLDSRP